MTAPAGFNDASSHASGLLLDSAAALARAEVRLLWSHARRVGARAAVALGLTWLAMMLTQIAVLLLALSPLIGAAYGGAICVATVAPATLIAALAWGLSIKKWLRLRDGASEPHHAPTATATATALELSSGEFGRR